MSSPTVRRYVVIWVLLAGALGVSLALGLLTHSPAVTAAIFAIAALKAGMVVAWYMHLAVEPRFLKVLAGGTVLLLVALFVGVFPDVASAWSVVGSPAPTVMRDSAEPTAPADPSRGEKVFLTYCVACHQPDGRGLNGKLAADFVGDPSRLAKPDEVLTASIKLGVTGRVGTMPPWGAVLKDQQVSDAVAFLRSRFGSQR